MAILDFESIFTNVTLVETMENCDNHFFLDKSKIDNLTKQDFCNLLSPAAKESVFFNFSLQSLSSNRSSNRDVPYRPNPKICFLVPL